MKLTKKDWIVILSVFSIAICIYATSRFWDKGVSSNVIVKVKGKIVGSYSLMEDREFSVGTNRIRIKNKGVSMIESDCKDQLCVHQREIRRGKEAIICLPNQVVIEIQKENQEIDSVAE